MTNYGHSQETDFIIISGIKGTGKTSLVSKLLNDYFENKSLSFRSKIFIYILTGSTHDKFNLKHGMRGRYIVEKIDVNKITRLNFLLTRKAEVIENKDETTLKKIQELDISKMKGQTPKETRTLKTNALVMKSIFFNEVILVLDDIFSIVAQKQKAIDLMQNFAMNARHLYHQIYLLTQHIQSIPTGITGEVDRIYIKTVTEQNLRVLLRRFMSMGTDEIITMKKKKILFKDLIKSMMKEFSRNRFTTYELNPYDLEQPLKLFKYDLD